MSVDVAYFAVLHLSFEILTLLLNYSFGGVTNFLSFAKGNDAKLISLMQHHRRSFSFVVVIV